MSLKKKHLEESKVFCMLPWTHMQIRPDGTTYNCCLADFKSGILGDITKESIWNIWNSDLMKETRRKMLNDEYVKQCSYCYKKEKDNTGSFRIYYNGMFSKYYDDIVHKTNSDGTLNELNLKSVDFRLSNICNFKCRSCGDFASSAWYHDTIKMYGESNYNKAVLNVLDERPKLWNEIEEILPTVEEIYFAGGEPLIMKEHYDILQYLIKHNKTNITIWYNTNFSTMVYKDIDVMKLWDKFENIHIQASLDGSHKRGEYIRKGQNWDQIVQNRERLYKDCPRVKFSITSVINAYNVWHLPDFYLEWLEKEYITTDDINFNIMYGPDWQTMFILPGVFKRMIEDKWNKFSDIFKSRYNCDNSWMMNNFDNLPKVMMSRNESKLIPKFQYMTKRLDKIRDEKFEHVFPELAFLMGLK